MITSIDSNDTVLIEVSRDNEWVKVGELRKTDPPGSVSSIGAGGRRLYLFGWVNDEAGIWETVGVDIESPDIRLIASVERHEVADLHRGPHMLFIQSSSEKKYLVRFSLDKGTMQ